MRRCFAFRFVIIHSYISNVDMCGLASACDVYACGNALRCLRSDVALSVKIQDRAKRDIVENFSISNFIAPLEALL